MCKEIQFKEEKENVIGKHLKVGMGKVYLYKHNTYKATFCKYKLGTEAKLSNHCRRNEE